MPVGYIQRMGLKTFIRTQRIVPLHWISLVEWIIKAGRPFEPTDAPNELFLLHQYTLLAKNVHASWKHTNNGSEHFQYNLKKSFVAIDLNYRFDFQI